MGARRSRTSARKMTVVKVRRAIAELILNLEGFLLSIKRERARVTVGVWVCVCEYVWSKNERRTWCKGEHVWDGSAYPEGEMELEHG